MYLARLAVPDSPHPSLEHQVGIPRAGERARAGVGGRASYAFLSEDLLCVGDTGGTRSPITQLELH